MTVAALDPSKVSVLIESATLLPEFKYISPFLCLWIQLAFPLFWSFVAENYVFPILCLDLSNYNLELTL